jgi:prolyl oligopeptidase
MSQTLVITADAGVRVVPAQSFKHFAALQATELGARPQIIRIDSRVGHGGGKPMDRVLGEIADMYLGRPHALTYQTIKSRAVHEQTI